MAYSNNKNWVISKLAGAYWFQEGPGVRNSQFTRSGIKLLNVANIGKYGSIELDKTDRYLSEQEVKNKYRHFLVDEGDLVIASSGISFDGDGLLRTRGAFVHKEHLPLCMNTSTIRFKSKVGVSDLHFLRFWLDSFEFRDQITRLVTGSAQQNFGPSHLKSIYITLPPLSEQKRIAAILEKADRLRRQCHFALKLSNTYLQSVFLEMFGDPATNPMGWKIVEFADLVEAFEGGVNFNPVSEDGPTSTWRVLKISSVTSGEFKAYESKAIAPDTLFDESLVVRKGDLIISRANTSELVGAVCMVRQTPPNILLPDKLWRIKLRMPVEVNANYLLHALQLPYTRKIIGELATGTSGSMKNISKDKTGTIPIMLPIKELQEKFSEVVQKKEQLGAQQREAERQAEHLFQTLLHQAFEGNVGLGSGIGQGEAVEDGVQSSVVDSELRESYVQLQMKY